MRHWQRTPGDEPEGRVRTEDQAFGLAQLRQERIQDEFADRREGRLNFLFRCRLSLLDDPAFFAAGSDRLLHGLPRRGDGFVNRIGEAQIDD